MTRPNVSRLRVSGITPQQVWDVKLPDGRFFWEATGARWMRAQRAAGFSDYAIASQIVGAVAYACKVIGAPSNVYLCGGLAAFPHLKESASFRSDRRFVVSRAGRDYAQVASRVLSGHQPIHVCDVGQTSIKAFTAAGNRIICARDPTLIPYGAAPDKAARTVQFVASTLRELVALGKPNTPILLALPCPVADDLTLGACTYELEKHKTFVQDVLTAAKVPAQTAVHVINDAELAGVCARAEFPRTLKGQILALSLGLGPGAALVTQR